jgi:hypothetical protein
VRLTQAEINDQAQRANWYVQADLRDVNVPGDPYIITGDGVDDLDRLISYMPIYPKGRFQINVGRLFEAYKDIDLEDVIAIKAAYIAYYGNVNKPGDPVPFPEAEENPLDAPAVPLPSPVLGA